MTDNQDGTATASITGSSVGSSNVVRVQSAGQLGTSVWTVGGSRSGDGSIVVDVDPGFYWAQIVSSLNGQAAVSPVVYFRVTDGTPAVWQRCLSAVQARIQALLLDGLDSANVVIAKLPSDQWSTLPAIMISPVDRETLEPTAGTNVRDDVGYPVQITILAADNQEPLADLDRHLGWREQIQRAFRYQRLDAVGEIITTICEPRTVIDPTAWLEQNLYLSAFVLRFVAREPRGVS